MKIGSYELLYIVCNIFGTYIIYSFMRIFFDSLKTSKKIEISSYAAYFVLSTVIYLGIDVPIIMMCFNLAFFFIFTFNYISSLKEKIIAVVSIYFVLMCVEMVIAVISGFVQGPINEKQNYSSIIGLVAIKLCSYMVVVLIGNLKKPDKKISIPTILWFCIFIIPLCSLYIAVLLLRISELSDFHRVSSMVVLLIINFAVFYLYDVISEVVLSRTERIILEQQNKYYQNQFDLMQTSLSLTRTVRHDIMNHLLAIEGLVREHKEEEILTYLSRLFKKLNKKEIINSGNIIVDSILNFKLQEAKEDEVNISVKINIPTEFKITNFDMTVILGNLIDNAINATKKLIDNKTINVVMKYDKGRLVIKIENTFNGKIKCKGKEIYTTNIDKDNHGIGIKNIKNTLIKYNGTLDIYPEKNVFKVCAIMYEKE